MLCDWRWLHSWVIAMGRRDTEMKTKPLDTHWVPQEETRRCLCECLLLYISVWLFVREHEIKGSSSLLAMWTQGIYGCHSFQRHGVLSCQGWLAGGWNQFPLFSFSPSCFFPPWYSRSSSAALSAFHLIFLLPAKHGCSLLSFTALWAQYIKTQLKKKSQILQIFVILWSPSCK